MACLILDTLAAEFSVEMNDSAQALWLLVQLNPKASNLR